MDRYTVISLIHLMSVQMTQKSRGIAAFKDEESNNTIPGLKAKVSECFKKGEYLPVKDGGYSAVEDVVMAVPFGILCCI